MGMMFCRGCGKQIHETAPMCPHCGAPQSGQVAGATAIAIPDGIKGWSWGAFLLNWIWAIGNKTWIGLLALVPYVGFIMAIVLGFKGREWAWKAQQWESVEHFNRVQKKWSFWGVVLVAVATVIGILAALAIPAYMTYKEHAAEAVVAEQEAARKVSEAELQKQMEEALQQAQQQEEQRKAQAATATAQQAAVQAAEQPAQADQSTVEQDGICKGLDMAVTADQYECQSRKFGKADGELNSTYKQLMASLDDSRKAALKREQISWIKEKESKCAKAGKEVEGGSMEGILINDCKITMTEERLAYLQGYK